MKFKVYHDVKVMYQDTHQTLQQDEVLNSIMLGNLTIGYEGVDCSGWRDPINWFMATITAADEIVLVALMTPPHNLTLYTPRENSKAVMCLIDNLVALGIHIPGVMAEEQLARFFAQNYTEKTNQTYQVITNQGIYELRSVNPMITPIGHLRAATKADLNFLPYWFEDAYALFNKRPLRPVTDQIIDYNINNLYVLEVNNVPVSMAKISRRMKECCCIGMVYTPPFFRNQGYATSSVAQISQLVLDQGFQMVSLYTDLDYVVSNRIYRKIGYVQKYFSIQIGFIPNQTLKNQ